MAVAEADRRSTSLINFAGASVLGSKIALFVRERGGAMHGVERSQVTCLGGRGRVHGSRGEVEQGSRRCRTCARAERRRDIGQGQA